MIPLAIYVKRLDEISASIRDAQTESQRAKRWVLYYLVLGNTIFAHSTFNPLTDLNGIR